MKATKTKNNKPTKEWERMGEGRASKEVKPFNCDESRLLALAGTIVADAVNCYRYAGYRLKDLEVERKAGVYNDELKRFAEIEKIEARNKKAEADYEEAMKAYEKRKKEIEKALEKLMKSKLRTANQDELRELLKEPRKPRKPKMKRIIFRVDDFPYHTEKVMHESEMASERIFFQSQTYQRLCQIDGGDVVAELDRQIAAYKGKVRGKHKRGRSDRTPFLG